MSRNYSGRLELTWTNKGRSLLAREDGSYEWVDPGDYRVAEVRLLHDVTTVGESHPKSRRASDNLLIQGDALHALRSLNELPEFAQEYAGKIRLVYIDPPFNTGQAFEHYDDNIEHSVWLTMLRDRLMQIKPLLAPNGSVWLHLDDNEVHRARCVLDEVFEPDAFVATVIWQKRTTRENRAAFSSMHDYLHVYSPKGSRWVEDRNRLPDEGEYSNPDNDLRGPWRSIPLTAQAGHATASQFYDVVSPTGKRFSPPQGRCWTYTRDRFDQLVADNRIYWPKRGDGRPRLKRFPEEAEGLVPFTIWLSSEVGDNDEAKKYILDSFPDIEPYNTPKPEQLIRRIVEIATDPGDVVLDCFVGSGSTASVAQKMRRRWVAVEWSRDTVATFTLPRLTRVVANEDPRGITETVEWRGGGGFRVMDISPSMFEVVEGRVYLAGWATNSALAETTAAQLGYQFDPDPPFSGSKGRTRLAVVDGLVNEGVVRLLDGALGGNERLCVCGTAVDPAARSVLRVLRPGSTLKKIPAALLDEYRISRRERLALTRDVDWSEMNELMPPSSGGVSAR